MFIDSATNSITRAPAERNVSANGTWWPTYVSLRWSEENLLEVACSINISPLMGRRASCDSARSRLQLILQSQHAAADL
jgi:hypothetical protein